MRLVLYEYITEALGVLACLCEDAGSRKWHVIRVHVRREACDRLELVMHGRPRRGRKKQAGLAPVGMHSDVDVDVDVD